MRDRQQRKLEYRVYLVEGKEKESKKEKKEEGMENGRKDRGRS